MKITMSHGNGGMETAQLIDQIFMRHFKNSISEKMEDAAVLPLEGELAFTTDSFVVTPLFFPGADIGRLAVCGTVNDLLTTGASPRYLSAAFILEEGCETDELDRIAASMAKTAKEADVRIVTGDTKVVEGGGGVYINTAGIGILDNPAVSFGQATAGDVLIVTGTLGDHHACILSQRLQIQNSIRSDAAPLNGIVKGLLESGVRLHGMRDITRGGLATVLNEIANTCALGVVVEEPQLPVSEEVRGFCSILGLDPLYMGNEGKLLVAVPEEDAQRALDCIQKQDYGQDAKVIGRLQAGENVVVNTKLGGQRMVHPLSGEGLPRIC